MPESSDPQSPLFWSAFVRSRVGSTAIDADVVEEIAQHAEEAYRALRVTGTSEAEALAAVTAEFADVPALVRAARASRRRSIPLPPPEPASRGCEKRHEPQHRLGSQLAGLDAAEHIAGADSHLGGLTFNIAGAGDPEQVPGLRVSSTAFPMSASPPGWAGRLRRRKTHRATTSSSSAMPCGVGDSPPTQARLAG